MSAPGDASTRQGEQAPLRPEQTQTMKDPPAEEKEAVKIEGGGRLDAAKSSSTQQQQQLQDKHQLFQCNLELLILELLSAKQEVSRLQSENDKWCEEYLKMKSYNELVTKLLHAQGLPGLQMPYSVAPERHHPQISSILSQSNLFGNTQAATAQAQAQAQSTIQALLQASNLSALAKDIQVSTAFAPSTPEAAPADVSAPQAAHSSLAAALSPVSPITPSPVQGQAGGMQMPVPMPTISSASELRSTPQPMATTTTAAAAAAKSPEDFLSDIKARLALDLVQKGAGASELKKLKQTAGAAGEAVAAAGGGGGGQPSHFPFGALLNKSNSNVSTQEAALRELQQLHDLQAMHGSSAFASGTTNDSGGGGGVKKEEKGKKRNRGLNLPRKAVRRLKEFLYDHFDNPYPSESQKSRLARELGLDVNQVNTWFINARMRLWKPLIEKVFNQMKERLEASLEVCKAKRQQISMAAGTGGTGTAAAAESVENEGEVNTLLEKLNKVKEAEDPRAKVAFMMTDEWSEREMQQTKARLSQELESETQAHQVWAAEADFG